MTRTIKPWLGGLAAFAAVAATTTLAAAQDAAGFAAIEQKRNEIITTAVGRDYYRNGGDAPQAAADGSAFQFFTGAKGDGAIYWTAEFGAHIVYGPVLDYFLALQRQNQHIGYPFADPANGPGDGCFEDRDDPESIVFKRQRFVRATNTGRAVQVTSTTICLGPNGAYKGVTVR